MKRLILALALLLAPFAAHAQSSPGLSYGQVPTAGQWNSYFAAKQDYNANTLTGSGTSGHVAVWSGVTGRLQDGGALPLGANPSATSGLSAVNGVATSYMRSDGAPALSQAIAPTWTATHNFSQIQARTDATYDIGASGANRFRDLYLSRNAVVGGTLTPTGGIVGVTTNSSASAGQVGEYIFSQVLSASAVPLTLAVAANVTSISLTAGDWDVWGGVTLKPAGTTVTSQFVGWINTVSATQPTLPNNGAFVNMFLPSTAGIDPTLPVGMTRLSLASTTTVYLTADALFSVSTNAVYGFIGARRVR